MIPVTAFADRTVAVFGLGGSGLATCRALLLGGVHVIACDDDAARMRTAAEEGIGVADLRAADWTAIDALVLAPGVPLTHPTPHWSVELAYGAGKEVIGDIELFCRERARVAPDAPFVAITGTNGKSTTTALIAHVLREAGRDVQMGGNIGRAILTLDSPAASRHYVIECSSYQIDLARSLAPSVGVLLNVTEDHLDRHGTLAHYAAVKERLVAKAQNAVIAVDDDFTRAAAARRDRAGGALVCVSAAGALRQGVFLEGTTIRRADNDGVETIADLAGIGSLRGAHNGQNAAAAVAAALALGVPPDAIRRGLSTFPGLPHRMEEVARRGRVVFVNDSKATNADSAEKALVCFPDVYWIAGGQPKTGGIESLRPHFARIRKAYLIGEAADAFARSLESAVPYTMSGTLERAVAQAAADAAASGAREPVVLLSPACASFDQFRNFEARGDAFRDLVGALPA